MVKRIINSNMIWAVIAVIINSAINFLIVPYVSENVGIEAYGFVTLANTFITYIDVISIALNAFAGRYIAIEYHKGNIKKASSYYSSIFFADLIMIGLLVILCLFSIPNLNHIINISEWLDKDVKILFSIVISRYCLVLIRNAFDVSTFIKNRLDLTEKIRAASYILQAAILLITCIKLRPHVWYIGLASFCAALFLLIAQYSFSKKLTPELNIDFSLFSWECIKDFILAGIWNSINNIGNLLNTGLDILITNKMLTELIMGMVSVSKSLGSLCYTLVIAISTSFRPKQLESYSVGNTDRLIIQLKKSMRITGSVCGIIIAGFFSCGYEFLSLWIPGQNISLIFKLSFIVLLSDILIGVVNPLYYVFTLTKKLKVPCFITIAMGLVNVISMYLLIKNTSIGAYAVVLTTMVLNGVHFFDTPIYSAYCLGVNWKTFYPPILIHLLNCIVNLIVMYGINCLLPDSNSWFLLAIKIVFLGFAGAVISFEIVTTKEEKKVLINKLFH